jgi:hypothetical protein
MTYNLKVQVINIFHNLMAKTTPQIITSYLDVIGRLTEMLL